MGSANSAKRAPQRWRMPLDVTSFLRAEDRAHAIPVSPFWVWNRDRTGYTIEYEAMGTSVAIVTVHNR